MNRRVAAASRLGPRRATGARIRSTHRATGKRHERHEQRRYGHRRKHGMRERSGSPRTGELLGRPNHRTIPRIIFDSLDRSAGSHACRVCTELASIAHVVAIRRDLESPMKRKPSPQSVYHAEKDRVSRRPIVSHAQLMAEAKAEYDKLIESDRAARKGGRPKKRPAQGEEAGLAEASAVAQVAAATPPSTETHAQPAPQPAKRAAAERATERATQRAPERTRERAPERSGGRAGSGRGTSARGSTRSAGTRPASTRSASTRSASTRSASTRRGAKNGRRRRTGRAG
jgi:hypothetical protein